MYIYVYACMHVCICVSRYVRRYAYVSDIKFMFQAPLYAQSDNADRPFALKANKGLTTTAKITAELPNGDSTNTIGAPKWS